MPTCPHCHIEIDEDVDMTDFENDESQVYLYYIGNCHKCHRTFKWREIYMLTNCNDRFEEIAP